MDLIKPLVQNIININYSDLSYEVIEEAKKGVLDTLASILAGSKSEGCKEVVEQVSNWGGKEESTIINYGNKVPAYLAGLANGTMARAVDLDDIFEPGTLHGSASIIPTALAVSEKEGRINGKKFIVSIVLGIDTICRMSLTNKIPPGETGMNVTFQYAYFGSAATAGKIMNLNEEKMINAMGLAYTQTAGNSQNLREGTLATRFCQGLACQGGIYAVAFAQQGITAAQEILEGKFGYYPVYQSNEYDRKKLLENIGTKFKINKLSRKKYPCCGHTHAAIESVLDIVKKNNIKLKNVKKIQVKVNQQGYNFVCLPKEKVYKPKSVPEAQFSLPYVIAVALVRGDIFLNDFTKEALKDPIIINMASKVECIIDNDLGKTGVTPAIVTLTDKNNRQFTQQIIERPGTPKNPLSFFDLEKKLYKCAQYSNYNIEKNKLKKLFNLVSDLEKLDDIERIIRLTY